MKSIANMYVMQWRIFAPDVLPYRLIITPFGTNLLKQALGFSSVSWNQENWDYVFQDGTLERKGKVETIPITWVGFNDRRLVVQVFGDSDAAHAAYSAISEALSELNPSFRNATPLVSNEETSCVTRLGFEWTTLLNPRLAGQVSKFVEESSTESIRKRIKGVSVRFNLGLEAGEGLSEYGITLNDQQLVIEPRADVPLSECTYFTYSPCDSFTHLRLVSEIETNLLKAKKERRSGRKDQ